MISRPELTLLEQLEATGVKIDTDSMDPKVAANLPIKAHDMTSNQLLTDEQLKNPENKELVEKTIRELKGANWFDVQTVLTARFAKRVIPYIQGRVLAQTTPTKAFDKDAIISHARAYDKAFQAEGISRDRYCVKVPATTAGVQAAKILNEEGIRTLGTSLFSLAQAIACSQAGMLSISPYYNEVRAHVDSSLWPDVADPATQHPMSFRVRHIRETYDRLAKETGKVQPLIKGASYITAREVMAMPELGVEHVTLLVGPMEDLCSTSRLPEYRKGGEWQVRVRSELDKPNVKWATWSAPEPSASKKRMAEMAKSDPYSDLMQKHWKMASTDVDYLADGVLDKYNEEDEVTKVRLRDALELFKGGEAESKVEIERLQKLYA
ncbi:transaldolase, putative [Cryptococcus deneoformans JEC21]|uniref:Transaldolase, putative n=1 Tax=Cryptococcus deneoformans (strain JEC21 / ATCC MYA-565) TaxID=214684 RepID=Q5KLJ1_CRYD1|nr:transaldolase, putative [Cryptococcus neoformans var. neoformans JEC21]AAW41950.1 transaldolase, putative [Cryptococcus neoformans var. neoformans JEC21]